MKREEIKAIIENILLAADQPVNEVQLHDLLADDTEKSVLKSILEELIDSFSRVLSCDKGGSIFFVGNKQFRLAFHGSGRSGKFYCWNEKIVWGCHGKV